MGWGLRVPLPAFPDGACRRHDTAADPRRDAKIVPMVRPHPVLFDLAAGRPPRTVAPDAADHLLESAIDHRMTGLLWSAIAGGGIELPSEHERRVAARDAAVELHHRRLWDVMDAIHARLHALGIGVAYFKGVVAEARWYDRLAERPCRDLDLLLEPQARTRIGEVLEALQPAHPFREQLPPLVRSGVLQSIDLIVDGLAVDVHLDLLKFEVPTRQAERIWSRVTKVATPEGRSVPTIDDEVSLIHFLLHANKDRFSRLIAYADVARVLRRGEGDLDWPFIDDFLRGEGLRVPVYSALGAITDGLGLPPATARPAGWRAQAWQALWPPASRLHGARGLMIRQHRQFLLPLLAEGRLLEGVRWLVRRRVMPPSSALEMYYPDTKGPYVARVIVGRLRRAVARRRGARLYQ